MTNIENLSKKEILDKIKYLENSIHNCIMNLGSDKYCQNRINIVKVLKTYLN